MDPDATMMTGQVFIPSSQAVSDFTLTSEGPAPVTIENEVKECSKFMLTLNDSLQVEIFTDEKELIMLRSLENNYEVIKDLDPR